ncbi:MAG TPA: alpha/beta hydrolase [Acidimicrobiales bacterium]|jgi:pimeloyl-ACP methyl ester carboxylesterase
MLREVNGVRLNVLDEGEGHPLVLLHGLGGCWRDWEPQLDHLRDRYRCIVIEHRGHGRSERTTGAYSTDLFAADAAAVCRLLGVGHAYVVGLSMGGMIAQKLALAEPDLVEALVLCDTGTHMGRRAAQFLRDWAARVRATGMVDSRGVVNPETTGFSRWSVEHQPHVIRTNMREAEAADPDAWARAAEAVAAHDTRDGIGRIAAPCLLVWGEEDPAVPVARAQALVDALGGAPLVVLRDAGHVCNLDQPAAFEAAVEDFFAAHPCTRTR